MADELGVHAALTDTPSDQLGVLAAEVDDEDGAIFRRVVGPFEGQNLAHYPMPTCCACCRPLPSVLIAGASMISAFWKSWIDS